MKPVGQTAWPGWRLDVTALAFCGAVTAGVYLLGVGPLFRRHSDATEHKAQLRSRREESRKLDASLQALKGRYAEVQEALSAYPLRLQAVSQTNLLLARISKLAGESGLKVDKLLPRETRTAPRYRVVPVEFQGQGSFPMCVRFLHRLRGGFPDIGVISVELRSDPGDPDAAKLHLRMEWYAALGTVPL